MFYLTNKKILQYLIDAHKRGVDVKIILDATAASNPFTNHELLRKEGILVKVENWGGKMHMKSAIIDDKYIVIGSMNWTGKAEYHNDENTLIIENELLAKQFKNFFNKLWASIPDKWLTGNPDPESPDSVNSCTDGVDNDHDRRTDNADESCNPQKKKAPTDNKIREDFAEE